MVLLAARMMQDPRWTAVLATCPMLVPAGCFQDQLGDSISNLVDRMAEHGVLPPEVAAGLRRFTELIYVRLG